MDDFFKMVNQKKIIQLAAAGGQKERKTACVCPHKANLHSRWDFFK